MSFEEFVSFLHIPTLRTLNYKDFHQEHQPLFEAALNHDYVPTKPEAYAHMTMVKEHNNTLLSEDRLYM